MHAMADKNNMCILIPTCDRSEAINFYLEKKLDIFSANCFDVVIYDSSQNNLTKNVVKNYIKKGYACLKYVHYEDPPGDFYGNRKTEAALIECAKNYEYVWLCGDHAILCLEEYKEELVELLQNNYDVIHIYYNKIGMISTRDMDYKLFFELFFWSMTHWCSFILSRRIVREMKEWMTKYMKLKVTTLVILSIFAALTKGDFKIAYINHAVFKNSPYRDLGIAIQHKDMLRGYAEMIDVGISNLPNEYEFLKSNVKKSFTRNTGSFSLQGIIELRAQGSLNLNKLLQYKKNIIEVTDVSISWFYLWCFMPQWIAKKISYSYTVQQESKKKLIEFDKNGSRIIIYGAGKHGIWIFEKMKYIYTRTKPIAISDKNWIKISSEYPIISPTDICKYEYDYVGIAIENKKIYKEARKELVKLGIPFNKIVHL